MEFAVSVDYRVKIKENERQILRPCLRTKKAVEHSKSGTGTIRTVPKDFEMRLEEFEIGE